MSLWARLDNDHLRRSLLSPQEAPITGGREAAVAVVLAEDVAGVSLLLIRRAVRAGDPWSGHIALPGGHRDTADGDLLATAMRETREELGLDLSGGAEYLGALGAFYPSTRFDIQVHSFVFSMQGRPQLIPNHEVDSALWLPLDDLKNGALASEYELVMGEQRRRFPAYRVGGDAVWGLTYRILTTLLERTGTAVSAKPPG
jgi:8-oxo-dGTP pyrophosphatase MutT (NUDIX family)